MKKILITTLFFVGVALFSYGASLAENIQKWTAENSHPTLMGWMKGFPPTADKRIMLPDSDFFSFPKMRWTVCHFRELLPTERISRQLQPSAPLDYNLDMEAIDAVTFIPMGGDTPMTWKESLGVNFTDGLLILHRGKVVYEYYDGCLDEDGKHGAMSMTKSLTGLLAEILVVEGTLDDTALVS